MKAFHNLFVQSLHLFLYTMNLAYSLSHTVKHVGRGLDVNISLSSAALTSVQMTAFYRSYCCTQCDWLLA